MLIIILERRSWEHKHHCLAVIGIAHCQQWAKFCSEWHFYKPSILALTSVRVIWVHANVNSNRICSLEMTSATATGICYFSYALWLDKDSRNSALCLQAFSKECSWGEHCNACWGAGVKPCFHGAFLPVRDPSQNDSKMHKEHRVVLL